MPGHDFRLDESSMLTEGANARVEAFTHVPVENHVTGAWDSSALRPMEWYRNPRSFIFFAS